MISAGELPPKSVLTPAKAQTVRVRGLARRSWKAFGGSGTAWVWEDMLTPNYVV